jgi:hypothetical protein
MSQFVLENPTTEPASSEDERVYLIALQSRAFENTPALRKLLTYLWVHRFEEINEYAIAVDALGRRSDFDPRIDAAVRVQVARLRTRLKDFYATEGATEESRITIRHGSHELAIVTDVAAAEAAKAGFATEAGTPDTPQVAPKRFAFHIPPALWIAAAAIALVAMSWIGGMTWRSAHPSLNTSDEARLAPSPWREFLDNHTPVRIVVPNPVFFLWAHGDDMLMVRDPSVNNFTDLPSSANLSRIAKNLGQPILAQDYTVNTDTRASFRLAQFLQSHGAMVNIANFSDISPESFDHENLILLGTFGNLGPFRDYLDRLHFTTPAHQQYIMDTQSQGNATRYSVVRESATRYIAPGIIGFLPGRTPSSNILVLAGYYSSALAAYMTSPQGLADIQRMRAAHKNCRYFGAIVLSEVDGVTPLRSHIVDFKPLPDGK